MRVIDELARVFHVVRDGRSLQVLSTLSLEAQFDGRLHPGKWKKLQRLLDCRLPPLEFESGHWRLPIGWRTIWDLAEYLAWLEPGRELPLERTEAVWREAQIFDGVRSVLMEAGNLSSRQVVRTAQLVSELFPD